MPSLQRAARHHQSIRTEGNATITTTSASGLATNSTTTMMATVTVPPHSFRIPPRPHARPCGRRAGVCLLSRQAPSPRLISEKRVRPNRFEPFEIAAQSARRNRLRKESRHRPTGQRHAATYNPQGPTWAHYKANVHALAVSDLARSPAWVRYNAVVQAWPPPAWRRRRPSCCYCSARRGPTNGST